MAGCLPWMAVAVTLLLGRSWSLWAPPQDAQAGLCSPGLVLPGLSACRCAPRLLLLISAPGRVRMAELQGDPAASEARRGRKDRARSRDRATFAASEWTQTAHPLDRSPTHIQLSLQKRGFSDLRAPKSLCFS